MFTVNTFQVLYSQQEFHDLANAPKKRKGLRKIKIHHTKEKKRECAKNVENILREKSILDYIGLCLRRKKSSLLGVTQEDVITAESDAL